MRNFEKTTKRVGNVNKFKSEARKSRNNSRDLKRQHEGE